MLEMLHFQAPFMQKGKKELLQDVGKLLSESFHFSCGHRAGFSIGKIDDAVFRVCFFYVLFVDQK